MPKSENDVTYRYNQIALYGNSRRKSCVFLTRNIISSNARNIGFIIRYQDLNFTLMIFSDISLFIRYFSETQSQICNTEIIRFIS